MQNILNYTLVTLMIICLSITACISKPTEDKQAIESKGITKQFFNLGDELVLAYKGSEKFETQIQEFKKIKDNEYNVYVYGDITPSNEKLVLKEDELSFILGWSGEEWISLKLPLKVGDQWKHKLRGYEHSYKVLDIDAEVKTPVKVFVHCIKIESFYISNEDDLEGKQKTIFYFAPNHWIVKQEEYSNGELLHRHVLNDVKYKIITKQKDAK